MSFIIHRHLPDERAVFTLFRDVYLGGAPVWAVQEWVRKEAAAYYASEVRRFSSNWVEFRGRTMAKARKHRSALLSDRPGPATFYLEDLPPLLSRQLDEHLNDADLPPGWDPAEKKQTILGGLHYVSEGNLTEREKAVFHMAGVMRMPRPEIADAMGITTGGVKAHFSNAWKAMTEDHVDVDGLEWLLSGKRREPAHT
ncbi:helix-turn-helix transcriptional regulator [Streptomyces spectabilis]|uniref:Uncharacterized protein n=1 Tax=Streptomyces spectabilis TaxID=68270 RepID=A0A516RJL5_STRST|nr:hypothetical protein [Streptomyces spectabilis]QDQ15839.1 hypothetical protein FH965_39180 [Streptomyces spectabilis]